MSDANQKQPGTFQRVGESLVSYVITKAIKAADGTKEGGVIETSLTEQGKELVNGVAQENAPIIEGIEARLNPEQMTAYEILSSKVAPKGGIFRRIFAKILHFGAKVCAFVGAAFVDNFAETNNREQNRPKLEGIFAWFLGDVFKQKDDDDEKSKKKPVSPRLSPSPT